MPVARPSLGLESSAAARALQSPVASRPRSTQVPDQSVVILYMTEIAKAYNVEYTPSAAPMPQSSTVGVPLPLPGMPASSAIPTALTKADFAPPASSAAPPPPAPPGAMPPPTGSQTSIPVAMPLAAAAPIAQPIAQPVAGASPMAVPQPFAVTLVKDSTLGLGLTLDAHNVVTGLKPGSQAAASGQIQVGDRVLSLNGQEVSDDHPVKTIAIDLSDGEPGTFVLLRGGVPPAPVTGVPPAPHAAAEAAEAPVLYPPTAQAVPAVPVAPAAPAAPAAPVEDEEDEDVEDEDDLLAKRLEMLKRG